ncbi:FecR domain-containing protein [Reichenbachiella sp. MALMAid0571]|uniref:FecR family protein n=1 Tax=Reichenbachiella sp. MALMAid0571 TaxID=3143939 RepID=UPI0032DF4ACB
MNYQDYNVDDFINDESFQSYVFDIDPKNELFWKDWLLKNPQKQKEAEIARNILLSFSIKGLDIDVEKYNHDLSRLQKAISDKKESKHISIVKNLDFFWKVAASILLFLGLGYGMSYFSSQEYGKKEITVLEKSNPKGRKSKVMLPDGSRVKLNADSYFKYEEVDNKRNVYLRGEAFFEVSRDASRPFTVYTENISTMALGTSFNVRAYPEDMVTQVYLSTGKVEVKTLGNDKCTKLTLEPGSRAGFHKDDQSLSFEDFNPENALAWKHGTIVFEKSDFQEVKRLLERWYGVDIEVNGNPEPSWRINGAFEKESLDNVLSSIHFTTPLDYSISKDKVKINFQNK